MKLISIETEKPIFRHRSGNYLQRRSFDDLTSNSFALPLPPGRAFERVRKGRGSDESLDLVLNRRYPSYVDGPLMTKKSILGT